MAQPKLKTLKLNSVPLNQLAVVRFFCLSHMHLTQPTLSRQPSTPPSLLIPIFFFLHILHPLVLFYLSILLFFFCTKWSILKMGNFQDCDFLSTAFFFCQILTTLSHPNNLHKSHRLEYCFWKLFSHCDCYLHVFNLWFASFT